MTEVPGTVSTLPAASRAPRIRSIGAADVVAALEAGIGDLRAAPQFGLFFGAVYAFGGLLLTWLTVSAGAGFLTYPLATGFALIGPFVAVGCYEVSRRREVGAALDWRGVLGVMLRQRSRELGWMAFVTLFVFIVWMYQVRVLFILCLGLEGFATMGAFFEALTSRSAGWLFLALVQIDGLLFALLTFSLTVVSFPLLLEREHDFVTAMITSTKAVTTNPKTMICWGLIVAAMLFVAVLPAFLGLIVVLPVLGHATWHLYRRLIEPLAA